MTDLEHKWGGGSTGLSYYISPTYESVSMLFFIEMKCHLNQF